MLEGRHRSARTAFGRLRGIALSDQHHAGILPQPTTPRVLSATESEPQPTEALQPAISAARPALGKRC
ncbi:hypothetical protein A4E84_38825 [Streptomyces qaidamensis]|uniref:Uncharacterized protein n=1 Tax=Streptomyces qaidamensis TaxID=1783515 RepID=A0A143CBT4_9ACTN|nr:hypothetical protein A4E84_38825 [Streptomyces qaidamensis]